jgi:hypothetical protein
LNASAVALKSLSLSSYAYEDGPFATLAPTLSRLTSLTLSGVNLGANALAAVAQHATSLTQLSLDGLQRSVNTSHLAAFASAGFAPHLESIHLRDLSGVNGDFFAAWAPTFKSLKKIHLDSMGMLQGPTFGASFAALPALEEFIGYNQAGRFWTDPQFETFITGATKLRVLRLGSVRELSWASLQHLFSKPKVLRELDLSGMRGLDPLWTKLLAAGESTLKASETNPVGLVELDLLLTSTSRHGLIDIVYACPNLEVLDISQIKCTEHGLLELSKLKKLRRLTMSLHEFHSPDVVVRIVKSLPTLAYLRVINETNIGPNDVSSHPNAIPLPSRAAIRHAAASKSLELVLDKFSYG